MEKYKKVPYFNVFMVFILSLNFDVQIIYFALNSIFDIKRLMGTLLPSMLVVGPVYPQEARYIRSTSTSLFGEFTSKCL